jgi:hypothetical protein
MNQKIKKRRELKEMEYEDAPSGYVKLYNYKEPYMKFVGGFGYQGTILFDGETQKIQCHFCGNWYDFLAPHIAAEHNMRASEYKSIVGLNQSTALISEKHREKLIANGLNKRLQNLRNRRGKKHSLESRKKIAETLKNRTREKENKSGTCPEQYDAMVDGEIVGYLRLRNGYFRVDYPICGGKTIFEAYPNGDGTFTTEEREEYLDRAIEAILEEINSK